MEENNDDKNRPSALAAQPQTRSDNALPPVIDKEINSHTHTSSTDYINQTYHSAMAEATTAKARPQIANATNSVGFLTRPKMASNAQPILQRMENSPNPSNLLCFHSNERCQKTDVSICGGKSVPIADTNTTITPTAISSVLPPIQSYRNVTETKSDMPVSETPIHPSAVLVMRGKKRFRSRPVFKPRPDPSEEMNTKSSIQV